MQITPAQISEIRQEHRKQLLTDRIQQMEATSSAYQSFQPDSIPGTQTYAMSRQTADRRRDQTMARGTSGFDRCGGRQPHGRLQIAFSYVNVQGPGYRSEADHPLQSTKTRIQRSTQNLLHDFFATSFAGQSLT